MKILFLQKRLLFPPDMGGKIRTLNVLRYLAKWHEVTYLCNLLDSEVAFVPKMCEMGVQLEAVPWKETPRSSVRFYFELAGNLMSRFPFGVNKDYDVLLRQRAIELLSTRPYDLLICDFVQMARNAIGLTVPAKLLFEHNVESQIFERHAQLDRGWLRRKYMWLQWRKMRSFESWAGREFDGIIAVSRPDAKRFVDEYNWHHVHVIDTAVDVDFFRPERSAEQDDRVVFVGSMDWLPNEDGVRQFVQRVWPEVVRRRPKARFSVVGRNPTASVKRLSQVPGVDVVGTVPDIRPYLAQASVVVVPLLVGGGTRLKIYEALSMEKAVVSTTLGAEGLDVSDGEHLVLADDPIQFARAITDLLENRELRHRIARQSRKLVIERFTAEQVARQFESICLETVQRAMAKGLPVDVESSLKTNHATSETL